MRRWAIACFASWTAAAFAGCLDHDVVGDGSTPPTSFVALQRDFRGFMDWHAFPVSSEPIDGHPLAPRTVYVNRLPSAGATELEVGTIVLKTLEEGAQTEWLIHAMAKRGGGFNADGARGWEWFELALSETGEPVIVWRGLGPPANHGYTIIGGQPDDMRTDGDCNGCHAAAIDTDYVHTPEVFAQ